MGPRGIVMNCVVLNCVMFSGDLFITEFGDGSGNKSCFFLFVIFSHQIQ